MKNKKIIYTVIVLVISALVILGLLALFRTREISTQKVDSIAIQKDGNRLTINSDGTVRYQAADELFEDFWDSDKTNAFFKHFESMLLGDGDTVSGGGNYVIISSGAESYTYILNDNELVDVVIAETSGGPTPPPATRGQGSGGGGAGGGVPGRGGGSGGSGSSGAGSSGIPSDCLYWRLSYCARPRTPSPTPSATPLGVEIREPNCEANTQTGKTVIGNEVCLSAP